MFLHAGIGHILFNMLGVWMFGVELERIWGTRFFSYYYAITGLGGGATMLLISLLPFAATAPAYTRSRSAPQARSSACCWRSRSTIPIARS